MRCTRSRPQAAGRLRKAAHGSQCCRHPRRWPLVRRWAVASRAAPLCHTSHRQGESPCRCRQAVVRAAAAAVAMSASPLPALRPRRDWCRAVRGWRAARAPGVAARIARPPTPPWRQCPATPASYAEPSAPVDGLCARPRALLSPVTRGQWRAPFFPPATAPVQHADVPTPDDSADGGPSASLSVAMSR